MLKNRLGGWTFLATLTMAGTLLGAAPDQEWPCKIGKQACQLKLENGVFQVAVADGSDTPAWSYAGTLGGYEPDRAGLYVGDLDGSGTTSVALFEKQQHVWYHGVFSGGNQLVFQPVTGEVFHLDEGPTLYAVDGTTLQPVTAGRAVEHAAAQTAGTVQPVFPIHIDRYTSLATSRNMDTNITVIADGSMYAVTKVHNGVWLTGYHGRAQVTFLGDSGPLYSYNSPSIGVTGTAFGSPDATAAWQVQVPNNIINLTRYVSIYQQWDPDFTTFIRNVDPWLKLILSLEQAIVTAVVHK